MNLVMTLIIIAAGVINAAGSALLKYAMIYRSGQNARVALFYVLIVLAMGLFAGGFPLYATALSRAKLSAAQPVFSATTYVATFLVSLLILKEPIVPLRVAGIAVIIAGITLVAA
jgi:multidrug transporter EmrE-like cation transporter